MPMSTAARVVLSYPLIPNNDKVPCFTPLSMVKAVGHHYTSNPNLYSSM